MVTCGSSRDAECLASSSFFWRWARRRRFWRAWRRSRASAGVRTIRRDGGTGISVVSGSADDADDAAGFLAVEASVRVEGGCAVRGARARRILGWSAVQGERAEFPMGESEATYDAPRFRSSLVEKGGALVESAMAA